MTLVIFHFSWAFTLRYLIAHQLYCQYFCFAGYKVTLYSKDVHRLRIIEGLFSMVIPSNMIALHTIHFAGEEHETTWSTVSCISKQYGSRDTRDQTQTIDHLIESLSCYTRSLRLYITI